MAYQTSKGRPVIIPAKGDAPPGTGNLTPPPTKPYVNPNLRAREFAPAYGTNQYGGPSSVPEGHKTSSPLADELKRVNAMGDGDDFLQHVIEQGTARNVDDHMSPQTRKVDDTPYPAAFGHRSRTADAGSPGGTVPTRCGAPVNDDSAARRDAALKRASE